MSMAAISVLVISDDAAHSERVREALGCAEAGEGRECTFRVESATRLDDVLERLHGCGVDALLLDPVPLDHPSPGAVNRVLKAAPTTLVLQRHRGACDDGAFHYTVHCGAHDEFVSDYLDIRWLSDGLRFAVARKIALQALRHSETCFRAISDASPLGIFVADGDGRCVYSNAAYQEFIGRTIERTLGTQWSGAIHSKDRERALADWQANARLDKPFQAEYRFQRQDGRVVWARVHSAAIYGGRDRHGHVQIVEDITAQKSAEFISRAAEQALFDENEHTQATLSSLGHAVICTDLLGNVTFMNPVAEKMTGWSYREALGRPLLQVFRVIDGTTRMALADPAQRAMDNDEIVGIAAGCLLLRRDEHEFYIEDSVAPIHGRDGQLLGAVVVFHDISQSRAMAQEMAHLAYHDFLTGLPNRTLLIERISHGIGLADRHGNRLALVLIDLDNFKRINDTLGHAVGDQLLRLVAASLAACVRATDTLCRQGGDEFVMLLNEIDQPEDAAQVVDKLRAAIAVPYTIGGEELHVTLSAGISLFPDDGINADTLIQKANTAMYNAKASGRDNYLFFSPVMDADAVRRSSVEGGLRYAVEHSGLVLHYQPKIDLVSGATTGSEALVRWRGTGGGLVYPEQFISIAEDCGLIVPIGQWVLREACRQTLAWIDAGLPAMPVAVNISAAEFRRKGFLYSVSTILQETGIAPSLLEFELKESVLMHDVQASVNVLHALKAMGVSLAVDDLVAGYSSLAYLRRFPISTLKIDRSLMRRITSDANNTSIASTMIKVGRVLKKRVVAEGVETGAQLAFLKAHQCNEAQGFHFSRPLSAADFARSLQAMGDRNQESTAMSKQEKSNKESKKKPLRTLKEKKAVKRAKKHVDDAVPSIVSKL